ncbi:ubinuclein-1 isoform X2 [Spea bombifrons]|uniref:ubinuclein-1 isoform X2 n=1 Tax=Spea bombifrons TaxID=233779 RepID=UPI00234B17A6|nr:ubinuclein-1 isoform X2 [Spea bombifrons]
MAEPRRVQLACLSPSGPPHPPVPMRPRSEEKESETPATIRLDLKLFEPDQKKCPEFCYPELIRKAKAASKKRSSSEKKTVNPFNDEEAEKKEVADIAQRFEEKYGNKKRRRDRMQDLIDMGYGYDESDSFIDNSEAYDELVPASLSTKFGGFYINTGTLQFRQASESEDEGVKEKKKSSPKKMKERGEKLKKKKRDEEKKSKKSKYPKSGFTALNGTKEKKKKSSINLTDMLARFQKEKEAQKVKSAAPPVAPTLKPSAQIPPTPPQEAEPAPDPLLSALVSETELLQAASAIESLSEKDLDQLVPNPPDKPDAAPKAPAAAEEFKKPPSLPDGLPSSLEKRIKELTKAVRVSEGDKKTIPFTQDMNRALLDIYLLSRDLPSALHSAVFTHLSSVLPCNKDTLVKWASRLYLHRQGSPLWEPLKKLKDAIAKAMPEQINKYHEECKVHNQSKYAKMLEEEKEKEQRAGSEEEEEEEKSNKKSASPRKKFQWNEEIRQLLCQLFRMKVEMFESEGSSLLSLEDYLKSFLDVEVKPLWPRGWMQARTLFKETRRVYPQLSSIIAKNRALVSPKPKAKEPSSKHDKKSASPQSENAAGTASASAKEHPAPSSTASPSQPAASPFQTYAQDNSLDGDLIHNPPSLDGVSEHLTALSNRSAGLDVSTSKLGTSEKNMAVEEKRKSCPPLPSPSVPTVAPQPPRGYLVEQSLHLGPEKKLMSAGHNPRPPSSESHQGKLKQHLHHGAVKSSQLNASLQPSVKLFQITNQHSKGSLSHPGHGGNPRGSAPSPPQRPTTQQTKPSKPQAFHSASSSASSAHKTIISPGFVGKHPAGGSNQQVYRPPVHRHPVPTGGNSGGTGGQNASASASPSPSSSTLPRGSTVPVKKPTLPPQKLTLVAPQDTGGGTQGVAKLLTSSMVAGVGGNAASPANIASAKSSVGSGLLAPGQSLTVLTPSYKPSSGKLPTPTSLGILSPIHTFPLHVISFTADPVPKAAASSDAIVTGPAPGTFHHGLSRNLLGGLHPATKHHPASVPHSGLPAHVQPGQTDGAHLHGKGPSGPQRKL